MCVRIVPLATCRRRSSRVAVQLPLRSLRSLRSSCTATHRYRYLFPNPTFHNGWYRKLGHPICGITLLHHSTSPLCYSLSPFLHLRLNQYTVTPLFIPVNVSNFCTMNFKNVHCRLWRYVVHYIT